jgi:hypothetical protein
MHRIRGKLTYSNVVATFCLVLLLGGGTAYAASQMLPKNSVGAKQLKKHAVTPSKLSKAAEQSLAGPTGARGPSGPQGIQGIPGLKGDPGPSNAYSVYHEGGIEVTSFSESPATYLTLKNLPAGSYLMLATLQGENLSNHDFLSCALTAEKDTNSQLVTVGNLAGYSEEATMAIQLTHTFSATGEAKLECGTEGTSHTFIRLLQITAIKVGSLRDEVG